MRNPSVGDRVVIPPTIGCGSRSHCRAGYFAQCDNANPGGPLAGTAFYGGPEPTGPFDGLQAEKARIPFANVGLVKLPDEVEDGQLQPPRYIPELVELVGSGAVDLALWSRNSWM